MKTLIAILFICSALSVNAQTDLRAVMVDTNGVVQKPTNFILANNLITTNQALTTNNIIQTMALVRGSGFLNMPVTYATTVITSGTTSFGSANYFRRLSTSASNSLIFVNANSSGVRISRGSSQSGIQWSRPVWLITSTTVNATSNAVVRIQLGGQEFNTTNPFIGSLTNVTNSSFQGMGLIFSNGNIFVEANHSGTNHSISSSIGTYATNFGERVDIKLRSSGTNSISVYFDNSLVTNLPFGPTNDTGNTVSAWNASINSGDSTNLNFIDLVQDQNTIIIE